MKHQTLITSLLLGLTFLIVGCGDNSAQPPATPPPPPVTAPTGQNPNTGNPGGPVGPVTGGPGLGGPGFPGGPGVGGPGTAGLPGGGNGHEYCDGEWCYEYYTENTPGVGQPGVGQPGTGTPGYNPGYDDYCDGDYGCGDEYYDGGYGYYSDYYEGGDYDYGYDYGNYARSTGSNGARASYRAQWGKGWAADGWFYYRDAFYLDSSSRALQRARATSSGTTSKLKIRARANR